MPSSPLRDQVAVVTGAAGRLGQRLVHALADHGARVVAVTRTPEEAAGLDRTVLASVQTADLSQEAAVEALFSTIADRVGSPRFLFHTAGGWAGGPFLQTSLAEWHAQVEANLTSTFLCFREAARHMQADGGRLVAFASAQGADRGRAEQAAYSAAKGGVVRLVEAVAEELAGTGVTAHAIAPSTILYDDASDAAGVPADHIVDVCLHLTAPAAGSLNGAVIRAYGP